MNYKREQNREKRQLDTIDEENSQKWGINEPGRGISNQIRQSIDI